MNNITIAGNIGKNPELKYSGNKAGQGTRVVVIGRLQIENYEKKDGTKGKRVEVVADEVAVSLRWGASDPVDRAAKALHATVIQDDEPPF